MSQRDHDPRRAKRSVSASVLVGMLLVPLSAYAASVLVSDKTQVEPEARVPAPIYTPVTVTDFATQTASAADLEAACGDVGLGMVAAELDGSISDIQQAALDALREICVQQGMPLPGKPAPQPITQTVILADGQPAPSIGDGAESEWEIQDDDHEWDDDDYYDDHDDGNGDDD